ncbi:cytochrome c maturation protein CcmE [Zoogloea sp.]|uniref:cytochrome c maturation protein CcmE n=1 Tax=Zoogloea sp. TaxID=49181 RepID=UPI0025EB3774|nr:cytochrome c maturation protein CcmE [Zoogloea sp.]MCK6393376.1 cytochrome c maturation protein CcmE [Zoogloea sp.]
MKPRQKRLAIILGGLAALGIAAALILNAFQSNLVFFFTPTQVANGEAPKERAFRIGGLVKEGSLQRSDIVARFIVTDTAKEIPVAYEGILPDLFSEGKGVVAQGVLGADGKFTATEVLAKHDENYMPPEAQAAVDKAHEATRTLKQ